MSDTYLAFRQAVATSEDLPVGQLVRAGCKRDPGDVIAAYDAPFPTRESKVGPRALPLLRPMSPDAPAAVTGRWVRDGLIADTRPMLLLWADSDPVIPRTSRDDHATLGPQPRGGSTVPMSLT
jgi:haloalkane dehalogenase